MSAFEIALYILKVIGAILIIAVCLENTLGNFPIGKFPGVKWIAYNFS